MGVNYLIACTDNANVEEAIINFCVEQNGNIKATLERRPSDSYQMWRYSYQNGNAGDPNWENQVNSGLAEIGNKFGNSVGLHSVLIGAEHNIQSPSRWDAVEFMAQSVNTNISSNPVSVTQEGWNATNSPNFVANIPSNDIYMTGRYVFRAQPPTPTSGPNFQSAIDDIVETCGGIIRSIRDNNPNMAFYAIAQTQESPPQNFNFRYPTEEEILLNVNISLAYGAKGIVYYLYAQAGTETGLLDANRNPTSQYGEVQNINQTYLNVHGSKFTSLDWKEGFTIHQYTQEPISSNKGLYDVKSKPLGGSYDSESQTYVEIGYFTDSNQYDYYMAVNRRATDTRQIEITFQVAPNSGNSVKDLFTGIETSFSRDDVGSNGQFTYSTTVNPGAGKLLRLNKAPAAPQTLTISNRTSDGQHPILLWDANSEPDLNHYAIYRGYQDSKTDPINWNSTPSGTTSNTTWTDPFVTISGSASSRVNYRVTAVDDASNESGYSNSQYVNSFQVPRAFRENGEVAQALPTEFKLFGNYPNPFNPETTIRLELPTPAKVVFTVFSITGAQVRTLKRGALAAGYHTFSWDGKDERGLQLPSGVYFYRFEAKTEAADQATFVKNGKMTLLR